VEHALFSLMDVAQSHARSLRFKLMVLKLRQLKDWLLEINFILYKTDFGKNMASNADTVQRA